jgi:OCT family organic cation transporter-like MFS transporter 4/5
MEIVGPSKRVWAGIVIEYFFAIGLVVLAGVAYALRDWVYIEIARRNEFEYMSIQEYDYHCS